MCVTYIYTHIYVYINIYTICLLSVTDEYKRGFNLNIIYYDIGKNLQPSVIHNILGCNLKVNKKYLPYVEFLNALKCEQLRCWVNVRACLSLLMKT